MAFLSSTDNIIDAVLTRKGRELLAKGEFKITKYAFSDDAINYALYDANAGSDADADILSLPILEPSTNDGALHSLLVTMPAGSHIMSWIQVNPVAASITKDGSGADTFSLFVKSMNTDFVEEDYTIIDVSNSESFAENIWFKVQGADGVSGRYIGFGYKGDVNIISDITYTFKVQGISSGLISDEITLSVAAFAGSTQPVQPTS
jgi:hypothetical protein